MAAKRASDRAFGFVFGGLFAVVTGVLYWLGGTVPAWSVALSVGFILCAIAAPGLLMPINRVWSQVGNAIAILVNYLVLGTFFYLVMLPFGLMSRLGRDAVTKKPDPDVESYWMPVRRQASIETYRDLF